MRAALFLTVIISFFIPVAVLADAPQLEIVARLDERPGNIAVAMDGRVFVTMHPFDKPKYKLMEIKPDGTTVPFPDAKTSKGLHNVIGLRATVRHTLMMVDMGTKDVPPAVVAFNLSDNKMMDKPLPIQTSVLTDQSFLQDLAYDWITNIMYIADMGQADLTGMPKPAIIAIHPNPLYRSRRLFADHPGVQPAASVMKTDGREVMVKNKEGNSVTVHAALNPITIDPQMGWLYFAPMGAGKIYRVPLKLLNTPGLAKEDLLAAVEAVADKPESDGMTIDSAGNIYLASVNPSEIGIIRKGGKYETYLRDERIVWPDGFAFGPDGMLYVTINQLGRSAPLNGGHEEGVQPYLIAKFKPLAGGGVGR